MDVLTPAERRAALMVILLLALGCGWDLWRLTGPLPMDPADRAGAPGEPRMAARDSVPADIATHGASAPADTSLRLDLNRAGTRELDQLPGIGPVLAGRIVAHRERHGPFTRVEDLLAIRGIGPRLYARLAPRVTTGPAPPYKEERPGAASPVWTSTPSSRGVQSAAGPRRVRADSTSVLHGGSR